GVGSDGGERPAAGNPSPGLQLRHPEEDLAARVYVRVYHQPGYHGLAARRDPRYLLGRPHGRQARRLVYRVRSLATAFLTKSSGGDQRGIPDRNAPPSAPHHPLRSPKKSQGSQAFLFGISQP